MKNESDLVRHEVLEMNNNKNEEVGVEGKEKKKKANKKQWVSVGASER